MQKKGLFRFAVLKKHKRKKLLKSNSNFFQNIIANVYLLDLVHVQKINLIVVL